MIRHISGGNKTNPPKKEPMPNPLTWTRYCDAGDISIWQGKPLRGGWEVWEVRNSQTGEKRECTEHSALSNFAQMVAKMDQPQKQP